MRTILSLILLVSITLSVSFATQTFTDLCLNFSTLAYICKVSFYMNYSLDESVSRPASSTNPTVHSIFTTKVFKFANKVKCMNNFSHFINSNSTKLDY